MIADKSNLAPFLSKRELVVWNTLQRKSLSIAAIARATKIPRMSVYPILRKLKRRNLILREQVGRREFWRRELNERLHILFADLAGNFGEFHLREKKITTLGKSRAGITVHTGLNNIVALYRKVVTESKGDKFMVIESNAAAKAARTYVPQKELIDLNNLVRENATITEAILAENAIEETVKDLRAKRWPAKKFLSGFIDRPYNVYLVPEDFCNYDHEIYIFGKNLLIIHWEEELALEIKNHDLLLFFKKTFDLLRLIGEKIDFNALVKKALAENRNH